MTDIVTYVPHILNWFSTEATPRALLATQVQLASRILYILFLASPKGVSGAKFPNIGSVILSNSVVTTICPLGKIWKVGKGEPAKLKTPFMRMGFSIKNLIIEASVESKPASNGSVKAICWPFLNHARVGRGTGCGTSVMTLQGMFSVKNAPPWLPAGGPGMHLLAAI